MDDPAKILELVKAADPANPITYVHDIVRPYARAKLDEYILGCQDCPAICGKVKSVTRGNPNASVLIIADSPSEDQVALGSELLEPFTGGAADQILNKLFSDMGVDQSQLFYINAVNCWPHKEVGNEWITRSPLKQEVQNCSTFVDYAIQLVQPLVIILMGSVASNLFKKESITNARGNWIEVKGIQAMPTYHPGFFLKIQGKKDPDAIEAQKWDFVDDLSRAFMYVHENYPEVNLLQAPLPLRR